MQVPTEDRPLDLLRALAECGAAELEDRALTHGGLTARVTGVDPAVSIPVDLPAAPNAWVVVRVRMTFEPAEPVPDDCYLHAALYYRLADMDATTERAKVVQRIARTGAAVDLTFRVRTVAPNRIALLRFDPTNLPGALTIERATVHVEPRARTSVPKAMPRLAMVLSAGRSGSTAATRLLGMHPDIMTNDHVEHDAWAVGYFLKLYDRVRHAPPDDDFERVLALATPAAEGGMLPSPVAFTSGLDLADFQAELRGFLDRYLPKLFASAGYAKTDRARCYAEKVRPAFVPALLDVYPDAKIVALFRDPHRLVTSVRGIERKWKLPALTRGFDSMVDYIHWMMQTYYRRTLALCENDARSDTILGIRYEDLAADPVDTMAAVSAFLGLDFPAEYEQALRAYAERGEGTHAFRRHQTSGSVGASLESRWTRLSSEERDALRAYPDVFRRLAYPLPDEADLQAA